MGSAAAAGPATSRGGLQPPSAGRRHESPRLFLNYRATSGKSRPISSGGDAAWPELVASSPEGEGSACSRCWVATCLSVGIRKSLQSHDLDG